MILNLRPFLLKPDRLPAVLGSGDEEVIKGARAEIAAMAFPEEVIEAVQEAMQHLIKDGPRSRILDLVSALAMVALIRVLGEEVEAETFEGITDPETVFAQASEIIDFNIGAYLFGNPPPPFSTIGAEGAPFDLGYFDADAIDDVLAELDGLDVSTEDQETFLDETGVDLVEELVEPLREILEQAQVQRLDVAFIAEP